MSEPRRWPRHPLKFIRHVWRWLQAAFLTLRYVDEHNEFPAIEITGPCRLRVIKKRGAQLRIDSRLVLWSHYGNKGQATILLQNESLLHIHDEFKLGPGTRIKVAPTGVLDIAGRGRYTSSHTLGDTTIAVREKVILDEGVGTGFGVFITDSDWHKIKDRDETALTRIGKNAYVATNAMILKGTVIGDDCVIGAATVIAGKKIPSSSLVAGNPGKVLDNDVSWEF